MDIPGWGLNDRRRRPPVNLEWRIDDVEAGLGECESEDDDEFPVLAPKTRYKRDYMMREWYK